MRRRIIPFLAAAAALTAAAGISLLAGRPTETPSLGTETSTAGTDLKQPEAGTTSPAAYRLREYQGKLAVFRAGESEPQQILDLDVSLLPPYDQGQLRAGIAAQGEEELARLLEDYTS